MSRLTTAPRIPRHLAVASGVARRLALRLLADEAMAAAIAARAVGQRVMACHIHTGRAVCETAPASQPGGAA